MTNLKRKFLPMLILALILSLVCLIAVGCELPFGGETGAGLGGAEEEEEILANNTSWVTTSPDGKLSVTMALTADNSLNYSVVDNGTNVLDNSPMGFLLEEDNLAQLLMFKEVKTERITGSYNNISGRNATVSYDCNQTTVTFRTSLFYLDVIMRAYDDGYAFRYNIRAMEGNSSSTAHVTEELTAFSIPEQSVVWSQSYKSNLSAEGEYFSYEELYNSRNSSAMDNRLVTMPMMYKAGRTQVYSLITESALIGSGYWGSFLQDANADGKGVMQTVHNVAGAMENDNEIALPFTSPWRLASVGTLAEVMDSEMTEKVYDDAEYWKPDNYDELTAEEQAIYTYDWVEPGVTAWNWLIESSYSGVSQSDWTMHYKYLELAAEMGWKYTVLDGGWDQNAAKATQFCADAAKKGVKVIVWCDAYAEFGYGTSVVSLRNKLTTWASWGIAGIKIDFFDGQTNPGKLTHQGEDSLTIEWYESIYQECAKLKMVVNCHGCNKPTGERRVYPNVINREAIFGNELYPGSGDATINGLFVRGSVGPTDFTPLVNPIRTGLTKGQQLALAALYESGQPSMAGRYYHYIADLLTDNPIDIDVTEFFRMLPAERDETKFLCGELDGYYVSALRSGGTWIVAGANASFESTASIDFSFLGSGNYKAIIYTDGYSVDDTTGEKVSTGTLVKTSEIITNASQKDITMLPNGGFVICLVPAN